MKDTKKETKLHFTPHTDSVHIWLSTASPLVERCGRGGCKATRQYINGAWSQPHTHQPKLVATSVEQQPDLWGQA